MQPHFHVERRCQLVGRLVYHQLVVDLEQNGLLPERGRSTETAVVKVVADFLSAADRGDVSFLNLLNHLYAAFDTVDQAVCYVPRACHCRPYADDTQLYLHSSCDSCKAIFARLMSCTSIDDVGHNWVCSNTLKLNNGKHSLLVLSKYAISACQDRHVCSHSK